MTSGPGKSKRRAANRRRYLRENYGLECWFCGLSYPEDDLAAVRLVPAAQGGPRRLTNMRWACSNCRISREADSLDSGGTRASVAATLRFVAAHSFDEKADEYRELADDVEQMAIDDRRCALCREVECEPGCPLRGVRLHCVRLPSDEVALTEEEVDRMGAAVGMAVSSVSLVSRERFDLTRERAARRMTAQLGRQVSAHELFLVPLSFDGALDFMLTRHPPQRAV